MNCPECGRFMKLLFGKRDVEVSAFWWVCGNHLDCYTAWRGEPIPAPEYDWAYFCETIPLSALLDWPELKEEYEAMWERLPDGWKKRFANPLIEQSKKGAT